ncbi:MAG: UDP-3-O-(3-hydroxymyristoyl)glucosamine N-acyltransferase [Candidatus Sumerlaeia bacterium]|nr:UDP-3-O-(3-hydroxymyristoyl)glucosamine N-acyltransferase [Candidatus Sumerlaeia bacterium]
MTFKVADLCAALSIPVPDGLGEKIIHGVGTLESATGEEVAFVSKVKYQKEAASSAAAVILTPIDFPGTDERFLPVNNVMESLLTIITMFHPTPKPESFVHSTASVAEDAELGENVFVGPGVVIEGGVRIGANTRIESGTFLGEDTSIGESCWISPNVTILEKTVIGNRVRIHPGTVIGADGFRYELISGRLRKIPQVGNVVIEDDVEIGANCTIDRAFLEETRVGARTKMDNSVHIAHNVQIGSDCILVAQVGIAGSTKVGRGVMIGGGAGLKDHITVGDGARIAGRSAIQGNVAPGAQVVGTPAIDVKSYARFSTFYRNFGDIWPRLRVMLAEFEKNRSRD